MSKRVLLGMSGGVDSSVSALLLKEQGYEVVGATMRLWEEDNQDKMKKEIEQTSESKAQESFHSVQNYIETSAINDAKAVCEQLGIEHHVVDLRDEFKEKVVDNFICSYMCAKTPNPCVECNKFMKFGAFVKVAQDLDCEFIATGHYARVEFSDKYNQYVLKKSEAAGKDQTYFLYGINKEILPKIIFPLADFKNKEEIRKIAVDNGLKVAEKKDSQEICFISDNDYVSFLQKQAKLNNELFREEVIQKKHTISNELKRKIIDDNEIANKNNYKDINTQNVFKNGNIVLKDGTILGQHSGLINYTIGQRKGLGIAYKEPLYVIKLDTIKNEVVVGAEQDLYSNELTANELNFLLDIDLSKEIEIKAKVRYRAKEAEAKLEIRQIESEDYQKSEDNISKDNINVLKENIENSTEKNRAEGNSTGEKALENNSTKNAIAKVTFAEPQRAITPGQSVVFYLGDVVLGGGKIMVTI